MNPWKRRASGLAVAAFFLLSLISVGCGANAASTRSTTNATNSAAKTETPPKKKPLTRFRGNRMERAEEDE